MGSGSAVARRVAQSYQAECLALAARFQSKNEALALLREASKLVLLVYWKAISTLGSIAAQAYDLDPTVGSELLAGVQQKLQLKMQEDNWQQQGAREVAVFAFGLSRAKPIQSRLLLEQEWAFQRSLHRMPGVGATWPTWLFRWPLLNPARAREMAWQAGAGNDLSGAFEAQVHIAHFLLNPKADENTLFPAR